MFLETQTDAFQITFLENLKEINVASQIRFKQVKKNPHDHYVIYLSAGNSVGGGGESCWCTINWWESMDWCQLVVDHLRATAATTATAIIVAIMDVELVHNDDEGEDEGWVYTGIH